MKEQTNSKSSVKLVKTNFTEKTTTVAIGGTISIEYKALMSAIETIYSYQHMELDEDIRLTLGSFLMLDIYNFMRVNLAFGDIEEFHKGLAQGNDLFKEQFEPVQSYFFYEDKKINLPNVWVDVEELSTTGTTPIKTYNYYLMFNLTHQMFCDYYRMFSVILEKYIGNDKDTEVKNILAVLTSYFLPK